MVGPGHCPMISKYSPSLSKAVGPVDPSFLGVIKSHFNKKYSSYTVILLPGHPASFAHKFLFQRVPGCNSIADLSLKIVFRTHKFAVGTH